MSMSIVVWVACSLSVPDDLPESETWKNYGRKDWAYEAVTWQVIVESAPNIDVPVEVKTLNSKVSDAIFATVEPTKADDQAYKFLDSVTDAIATKCKGAVLQGPMGLVQLDAHGKEM